MWRACLDSALGSFISNVEETYMDSLDPEELLQCLHDKTPRSGPAGFLSLSSAKRIILRSQANWLLVPSMLVIRLLGLKSVIVSQAAMGKAVEHQMLSTKPGTLDERPRLAARGRALLVMKTGIKICGNRPAPHLPGAQAMTVARTALQALVMERQSCLAAGMRVAKPLPGALPWGTMDVHSD